LEIRYFLVVTAAARMAAAVTTLKSGAVFAASIVARVPDVALSVMCFVRVEVTECLLVPFRHRSYITVVRIVAVIDVAVEAVRAMEPWACADEYSASEPIGTIVAVGSTGIWSVVKISVRTHRRHTDVNGDLSGRQRHTTHHCNSESKENK
jgi:hypothetical protein